MVALNDFHANWDLHQMGTGPEIWLDQSYENHYEKHKEKKILVEMI